MTKSFLTNYGPFSLSDIALAIKADIYLAGKKQDTSENITIKDIATLEDATKSDLAFYAANKKYADAFSKTKAAACITSVENINKAPSDCFVLVSANPYADYARITALFYPASKTKDAEPVIHSGAFIGQNVKIGNGCEIYPGAYLADGIEIGENCIIHHDVTLSNCVIGNNVIIHPGTRVGQDGFGYAFDNYQHVKVPQIGRVIIGNDVEIGANCTIDRGAIADTIIGDMCKIDNLVQIGHNVKLGRGCIIVSQVGISGSTELGQFVVVGGQVGIAGHLHIGNAVQIAAQSGVMHDIADKQVVGGSPSVPIRQWHKQSIELKRLANREKND